MLFQNIPHPFKQMLTSQLGESNSLNRKKWIDEIVKCNYKLSDLLEVLNSDTKTANRFLWLMSEIGLSHPDFLRQQLPELFKAFESYNHTYRQAFASYWLYVGIPQENESQALDFLLQIIKDRSVNFTIKLRAAKVLGRMAYTYPELTREIKMALLPLQEDGSSSFRRSIQKIIETFKQ